MPASSTIKIVENSYVKANAKINITEIERLTQLSSSNRVISSSSGQNRESDSGTTPTAKPIVDKVASEYERAGNTIKSRRSAFIKIVQHAIRLIIGWH